MNAIPDLTSQGEMLALGSALIWAFAVILFRLSGRKVSPLGLNFFKSALASILLTATLLILGAPLFPGYPVKDYGILLLSGIIGIGFSDTLLFASLNRIGAGLNAIVNCSYSPFVIVLAVLFLSEKMSALQFLGVGMIIGAVLLISWGRLPDPIPFRVLLAGIGLGILSMLCMAVSIILMKPLLNSESMLWATLYRTLGGLLFTSLALSGHKNRKRITAEIFSIPNWKVMVPGSILGAYLALLTWMAGMTYASASVASVLNQTNTVFIFILAVFFLKEKASPAKLAALVLALGGVLLVTLS